MNSSIHFLKKQILTFIITVFGAHCVTYMLLNILPSTAELILGINIANQDLARYIATRSTSKSYFEILNRLAHFDIGKSVDGLDIQTEIIKSCLQTLPFAAVAIGLVFGVSLSIWSLRGKSCKTLEIIFRLFTFFPVYGYGFLATIALLSLSQYTQNNVLSGIIYTICISIAPASMIGLQSYKTMLELEASEHHINLLSLNVPRQKTNRILLRNLINDITPSFEKITSGILIGAIFTEYIIGRPGIGSLTVHAIKIADTDLILGIVLLLSALTAASRVISNFILYKLNK